MPKAKVLELGGIRYNAEWLRSVPENVAIKSLPSIEHSKVRNAWKQANGFSVPNYSQDSETSEPVKKSRKSKKNDNNEA